jgi:hypothetical protein
MMTNIIRISIPPISSDPSIDIECSVCLENITVNTRGGMVNCSHVFHNYCINIWHAHRHSRNLPLNCPLCRVQGPSRQPRWSVYNFSRSLRGPWGSVTITPELLIVHAQYWFSQPIKQLIRYSDISRYYRNKNTIFIADAGGAILTSFSVRKSDDLFIEIGTAVIQNNHQRYGVRHQ